MHSLKVMWRSRRSGLLRPLFSNNHRDFSRLSESAAANDFDSVVGFRKYSFIFQILTLIILHSRSLLWSYQVLVEGEGCSRTAILNRPHVLNALNISMVGLLSLLRSPSGISFLFHICNSRERDFIVQAPICFNFLLTAHIYFLTVQKNMIRFGENLCLEHF